MTKSLLFVLKEGTMRTFFAFLLTLVMLLGAGMHANNTSVSEQTIIILLGPPGSGKGTQAVQITKELKIPHISTGDLFRDSIKGETALGKQAKSFIDAGQLVPDSLVLDMLFDRISMPDLSKEFLLDGFPRTIPQAEIFDKYVARSKARLIVLNLSVPDDLIIQRAAGRLTCSKCGQVHNKSFSPPVVDGVCDICKGNLIQRSDDEPEVVKERLRVFHAQTQPLVKYYTEKGVLTSFDGTKPPQEVFRDLMVVLRRQRGA